MFNLRNKNCEVFSILVAPVLSLVFTGHLPTLPYTSAACKTSKVILKPGRNWNAQDTRQAEAVGWLGT